MTYSVVARDAETCELVQLTEAHRRLGRPDPGAPPDGATEAATARLT